MGNGADARRLAHLRWLCRRGMKELDVLLEAFLEREGSKLAEGDWPEFETLLQCEDDRLWDWMQGRDLPQDPQLEALVAAIRGK